MSRSARTAAAPGADGTVGHDLGDDDRDGRDADRDAELASRSRRRASSAKRAETATGTGPGSGKAVATRVRAASGGAAELRRSRSSAARCPRRGGRARRSDRSSCLGAGGAEVAVQSDPAVVARRPGGRHGERDGYGDGVAADRSSARRPAGRPRPAAARRPSRSRQPVRAGRRAARRGRCRTVRRPVASCSSSRGVTVSGAAPVAGPGQGERGAGRDGDAGDPGAAARARRRRSAQLRPPSSRPRSSASARVVSTATSRGASPALPSHCPTAMPRSMAGLTAPAGGRADRRALPGDRRRW